MNLSLKGAVTGAALLVAVAGRSEAQAPAATASINATASVQTALQATAVRDLAFGATFGGIARTVLPTDVTSGEIGFTGSPNAEIAITFTTLPTTLAGPAGATMPISYGASAAASNPAGTRAGATVFDPSGVRTVRLDATTGALGLYLGGTVTPAAAQAAGNYSSAVMVSASYTGN